MCFLNKIIFKRVLILYDLYPQIPDFVDLLKTMNVMGNVFFFVCIASWEINDKLYVDW